MSAIYWVRFDDGSMVCVNSADARSFKAADIRASYRKARDKAKTKHLKANPSSRAKVLDVRCVG